MAGIQDFKPYSLARGLTSNRPTGESKKAVPDTSATDAVSLTGSAGVSETYDPLKNTCLGALIELLPPVQEQPGSVSAEPLKWKPDAFRDSQLIGSAFPSGTQIGSAFGALGSQIGNLNFNPRVIELSATTGVQELDAPKGSSEGVSINSILSTEFFGLSGRKLA